MSLAARVGRFFAPCPGGRVSEKIGFNSRAEYHAGNESDTGSATFPSGFTS